MNEKFLESKKFNIEFINKYTSKINADLINYIENNIIPKYSLNDKGHNANHVRYVLNRAIEISCNYKVNPDVLYTCVMYHDVACSINRDIHELLSAEMAFNDEYLNNYFNKNEMKIIKEAIEDHRASLEYIPRNIYGKILSSADRKIEVKIYLISSLSYGKKNYPEMSSDMLINRSLEFANKKFGKKGYAINKSYVNDEKYKQFLLDIQYLINHKENFNYLANIVLKELENSEIDED